MIAARRPGEPCHVSPAGTDCPGWSDELWLEHRAVGHRGLDVEHRRFADDDVRAQGHATDLDVPVVRAVAGDRRVLADEGAAPDREQVGGDGDLAGQQDDPRTDLRAERTEVEAVGGRAGEHHHRVRPDQDLDDPEAQVRRAPDRDRGRSPSADQHPLEDHGERDEPEEPQRSDADGAQVEVEESGRRRGPAVGPGQEDRDDVGVGEEEQELRRAAEDHRQGAGARAGGSGRGRRHGDGRPRFGRSSRRSEGGRQARQGGVGVDVGHGDGRQAGVLAHLGAEARHQQRVGAEIVEEVGARAPRSPGSGPRPGSSRAGLGCPLLPRPGPTTGPTPSSRPRASGSGRCPASPPTAAVGACGPWRRSGP